MTQTPALSCQDVTKAFSDDRGVFNVSLSIAAGSAYAILGPNGSGKTTLINLCLGYIVPDRGRIEIQGQDITAAGAEARTRIAYVPEVARLYPHLTAFEHFVFFDRLLGHSGRNELHRSVLEALRLSAGAAGEPVRTYSKGMRQKVAIALGLLKGADVFLLDEPTSGLDPKSTTEFANVVQRLKSDGKAILMSTHDILGLPNFADRIGLLQRGRLLREGDTRDVAQVLAEAEVDA
jgi:ABC-2 type transport system ATP-binding protein